MIDYTQLEYVDVKLTKIDDSKKSKFEDFIELLKDKEGKNKAIISYRGTGFNNIKKELLKYSSDWIDEFCIYEKVFLIGQKSSFAKARKINPHKREIYLHGINDCSKIVLDNLFTQLSNICKEKRLEKKVEKNTSKEFKNYFLNQGNRLSFIDEIHSQEKEVKLFLRDYYLYFIHTSNIIKEDSILVSTSTKISTARCFTSNCGDRKIIFHYFICEPYICHTFTPWKMKEFEKAIEEEMQIPLFDSKGLFPNQHEVAIKGGLFPHNIFGIELVTKKKFIVNPHLFNDNNDLKKIFKYGQISINQSNFDEDIKKTEYSDKILKIDCSFDSKSISEK